MKNISVQKNIHKKDKIKIKNHAKTTKITKQSVLQIENSMKKILTKWKAQNLTKIIPWIEWQVLNPIWNKI